MGNGFSCQNHILAIKIWLLAIILANIIIILRDIQLPKYSKEKNNKIQKPKNKEIHKKYIRFLKMFFSKIDSRLEKHNFLGKRPMIYEDMTE